MNGRHAGPPGQPNVQTYLVTLSHIVFALSAFRVRACALLFFSASCGKTHSSRTATECNAAHSTRCLFGPLLGCLPSARHCSQVSGFLVSNRPLVPFGRNCVRGKARSQAWQVIGLAAASTDLCSPSLFFGGFGQHSLHLMLRFFCVR